MTKTEHLQFLLLMIPTFLVLVAAAVSMADLAFPAQDSVPVAAVQYAGVPEAAREERPAE
jgi:hypothetical protein